MRELRDRVWRACSTGLFLLLLVTIFIPVFASGCSDCGSVAEWDERLLKKFRIEVGYEFKATKMLTIRHGVKENYPGAGTLLLYRDRFSDLGYEKYVEHNKRYTSGKWEEFDMEMDGEQYRLRRYKEYWKSVKEKKMILLLLEYASPYENGQVQLNTNDLLVNFDIMPLDGVETPLCW